MPKLEEFRKIDEQRSKIYVVGLKSERNSRFHRKQNEISSVKEKENLS